jgi:outer membrane protein assembly factor BamA
MSARVGAVLALGALALAGCGGASRGNTVPLDGEGRGGKAARLEDLKGDLVSVDVAGVSKERAEEARSALHSAVGTPFDRTQVAADVRALFALGSIADVRAEGRLAQGGVALRFVVREQPRIRSIELRGSTAINPAQWQASIPVKRGDFFDPIRLTAIRRGMADQLQRMGFLAAKVGWSQAEAKGGGVEVLFSVEEGRAVAVAKVELRGTKALPKKAVLDSLARNGIAPGAPYWRAALEAGLNRVSEQYFDLGYVNVFVGPVGEQLSQDGGQMTLVIPIKEGDQFRLGDLVFEGALAAPKGEYASALGVRKGQVFSRRKLSEGLERIRQMHQTRGKPNVDLVPVTEVDVKKKRIKVTLQVLQPGAPPPGAAPGAAPGGVPTAPGAGAPAAGAPAAPAPAAPAPAAPAPAAPAPGGAPATGAAPPAKPPAAGAAGAAGIPGPSTPPASTPPAGTPPAGTPAPAAPSGKAEPARPGASK